MNTTLKLFAVAATAAAAAGCTRVYVPNREVVHQPVPQPVIQAAPQPTTVERVTIVQQPAPPVEQIPPAPAPIGYSWVAGHYEWKNGAWVWEQGRWVAGSINPMPAAIREPVPPQPSASARWLPGHWTLAGNEWVWVNGRWL